MNRLQTSSFSFAPAVVATLTCAAQGCRLRFAHVFVAPMLIVSFVNHGRDYYEGPSFDTLDVADRVVVSLLTLACLLDAFALALWQIFLGGFLAMSTLGLYVYSLSLKNAVVKGPAAQPPRVQEPSMDPEIVHAWMHACAGASVLTVLL